MKILLLLLLLLLLYDVYFLKTEIT